MLFNSYDFIFLFLVPVVFLFYILRVERWRIWFLILASVVFYGQWSLVHLGILLSSVCLNYGFALWLKRVRVGRVWLLGGFVVLDLLPLGYFKYSYFLHISSTHHLLPLAISFFTFQQIAFLVDCYREKIRVEGFREYLFFVLFFPQLVAGPIVHYRELIPQIKTPSWLRFKAEYFRVGVLLFSMGLFKKVVLADRFGDIANSAFSSADLSSYGAWIGVLGYSFEIYFDFSGYGDMAVGLGLLFGLKLPVNFDSPYKARDMVEFWRRWHITLSRFLRDYVYIPLGGNRVGRYREILNLLITMCIGGVWHGAGWGFLAWGFLHGVFLVLSHFGKIKLPKYIDIVYTFFIVTLLWVLFRADGVVEAFRYYGILFDFHNFHLEGFEISREGLMAVGFLVVWFLPNSFEVSGYKDSLSKEQNWIYIVGGFLFFVALKMMAVEPSRAFVYFNF